MGRAKEIIVKVIPAKIANEFVKKHHYSGKVVPNSTLHFGCFLDDKLHGVNAEWIDSIDNRELYDIILKRYVANVVKDIIFSDDRLDFSNPDEYDSVLETLSTYLSELPIEEGV